MKLSIDNPKFAVYDDVFDETEFGLLWNWVQREEYTSVKSTNWQKVWRLGDGNPLNGKTHLHSQAPFGSHLDLMHKMALKLDLWLKYLSKNQI